MSTSGVVGSIAKTVFESSNPNVTPYITLGKIDRINTKNMTADIYVYELSSTINGIPLCFPTKGEMYGSYFVPSVGETCLLAMTGQRKLYILTSATVSPNQSSSESLSPGENLIKSIGGACIKQDMLGNNFQSSSFGNMINVEKNGINSSYSTGKQEFSGATKHISGIAVDDEHLVKSSGSTIKMVDYSEYYSEINLPKIYTAESIIIDDGKTSINKTIRNTILNEANDTLNKIESFYSAIDKFREDIKNPALTSADIATKVAELNATLYNNYGANKSATLIIEKGNALNKSINNIYELSDLVDADFAKSPEGSNICFRVALKNPDTEEQKAEIYLDADGNMHFNCKKFIVDAEDFIYNEK